MGLLLAWFQAIAFLHLAVAFTSHETHCIGPPDSIRTCNASRRHIPLCQALHQSSEHAGDYDYTEERPSIDPSLLGKRQRRMRPLRKTNATKNAQAKRDQVQARHQHALQDPSLLTQMSFDDRTDIHPLTKRAITDIMGLQRMTQIQAKSYTSTLNGDSILARARTGTGKSLAFLLPSVQRLLDADVSMFHSGRSIGVIVVVPTRELAIQIADQAESLLYFHNDLNVACIYGGTKLQRDIRLLSGPKLPAILVATPGRLLEHLENSRIGRQKFSEMAQETKIVVLDEADRLFEGFAKETKKILSFLPRSEKRQTLLYSATVPTKLRVFLKGSMKMNLTEIDCVMDDDTGAETETSAQVLQSFVVLPNMDHYILSLVAMLKSEMGKDSLHKILVFFPANKLVKFFANLFNLGLNVPVLEIHSGMSQASRNRASNTFRAQKSGILFSSDVSARGVDYPGVTLVIQYGSPANNDSYIHRLGRTGRAGRGGKGLVVLLPFERGGRQKIADRAGIHFDADAQETIGGEGHEEFAETLKRIQLQIRSGHSILTPSAEAACKAFLAYYIANPSGADESTIVASTKAFAAISGLASMPPIKATIASRLGVDHLVDIEDL